jgi:NAD(P)-dependent dehydrogenase (short-subunit alcohol dehydrogenase family)
MTRKSIVGRRVLVTGGARGVGAATVRELARRGARVSVVGLEPELLERVASEGGPGNVWFEADVTNSEQLEEAVANTTNALGGLDAVVANAGISNSNPMAVGSIEAHIRTVEVNVGGLLRTARAALPALELSRGYLLFVASVGSFAAMPGMATYCATKAAAEHLATGLRLEWRGRGIMVGSAHPTFLDTDLVRDHELEYPTFSALRARLPGPLGATISPEQCASALVDAIADRRRKVYIPRSLAVLSALRTLGVSKVGEQLLARLLQIEERMPKWEQESISSGRDFGSSSLRAAASSPTLRGTPAPTRD